jgi:hypothetical protein
MQTVTFRKDQTIQFDDHRMTYGWLILTLVESFLILVHVYVFT